MAEEQDINARAEHGDKRYQEMREKYGELADLTVEQLQQRAEEQGVDNRSQMNKSDLIDALSNK